MDVGEIDLWIIAVRKRCFVGAAEDPELVRVCRVLGMEVSV